MTNTEERAKADKRLVKSPDANKKIDSKKFVSSLDACKEPREIYKLLSDNMTNDVLRDRLNHVSDNSLVVALQAQAARVNIKQGWRTSHQEYMLVAADTYHDMTGKEIKDFKKELNGYIAEKTENKAKENAIQARKEAYLEKLKQGKTTQKTDMNMQMLRKMQHSR